MPGCSWPDAFWPELINSNLPSASFPFAYLVINHGASTCSVRNADLHAAALRTWRATSLPLLMYIPAQDGYPAPGDYLPLTQLRQTLVDLLQSGTVSGVLVDSFELAAAAPCFCWKQTNSSIRQTHTYLDAVNAILANQRGDGWDAGACIESTNANINAQPSSSKMKMEKIFDWVWLCSLCVWWMIRHT